MSNPISLFDKLPVPGRKDNSPVTFSAVQISDHPSFHIGKDVHGRPVLVRDSSRELHQFDSNIELENLRVAHNLRCKILKDKGQELDSKFTIVQCLSDDRALHEYFLGTLYKLLICRDSETTPAEASHVIDKLAELFLALSKPQVRSARGLWAELFLISISADPFAMAGAWHNDTLERYDFSYKEQHIEVKSSASRQRRHHFSYEQAYSPPGAVVLVASLFLEQATNGTSLSELWDRVKDLVASDLDLVLNVENICIAYLGNGWQKAKTQAFDENLASSSLDFFNLQGIPRVTANQPDGVSGINFLSDLDLASPIMVSDYLTAGSLFENCLAKL